jgi:hypothetical protein
VSGYSWTEVLAGGRTAEQTAAAVVADPAWGFDANPLAAIGHASGSAANAYTGAVGGLRDNAQARYWTLVGLLLVDAAGSEHVQVGATLGELADAYGLR